MSNLAAIQAGKKNLRAGVERTLKSLTPEEREVASTLVCERLASSAELKGAKSVLGFAPMPGEINIWPVLLAAMARGLEVALPRFDRLTQTYTACVVGCEEDLQPGYFGIREPGMECLPLETKLLDLILVPGLAFDLRGRRLGRGKGFYDRLLKTWRGVTCGVCYDQQIVDEVPVETHDVQLDCILTPTRYVRARRPE